MGGFPDHQKQKKALKKAYVIIGAAVLVLAILLISLPPHSSGPLKGLGTSFFLPFFKVKDGAGKVARSVPASMESPSRMRARIEDLETRLQEAEIRLMQADELSRQYNELTEFLNFPDFERWDFVAGRVIGRDPANWWRTLIIDIGSKEKLRIGMPVVTSGLVGKIIEVHSGFSKVQLLGDDQCQVGAMLYKTGEAGIIRINNSNRVNPMVVDMDFLPSYSAPEQGDWVITSGLGGTIPKGLRIGQVLDSETVGYGLYKQARVKLDVKMSSLEQVWIIRI